MSFTRLNRRSPAGSSHTANRGIILSAQRLGGSSCDAHANECWVSEDASHAHAGKGLWEQPCRDMSACAHTADSAPRLRCICVPATFYIS
jgi:hypothetical protein